MLIYGDCGSLPLNDCDKRVFTMIPKVATLILFRVSGFNNTQTQFKKLIKEISDASLVTLVEN